MMKMINRFFFWYLKSIYLISYYTVKLLPNKILRLYLELLWKIEDKVDTLGSRNLLYISSAVETVMWERNYLHKKKILYREGRLLYVGSSNKFHYYFDKENSDLYVSKEKLHANKI